MTWAKLNLKYVNCFTNLLRSLLNFIPLPAHGSNLSDKLAEDSVGQCRTLQYVLPA